MTRFPVATAAIERRFWDMVGVLDVFMRRHNVRPFDPDDTRVYRIAISDEFWQAARHHAASSGDRTPVPEKPSPGYHLLFGYPILVDPTLRGDELRLEDRR